MDAFDGQRFYIKALSDGTHFHADSMREAKMFADDLIQKGEDEVRIADKVGTWYMCFVTRDFGEHREWKMETIKKWI